MPRPKGIKKGLTDQEKKQILELRNQGISKDNIGTRLHIAVYKITEYLNEVGDTTDLRGTNIESVDIDKDDFSEDVLSGMRLKALCDKYNISENTCIQLKGHAIKERDAKSITDHDLTVKERDDDNWLVVEIKRALGPEKSHLVTFNIHKEITIGGERTLWQADPDSGFLTFDKKEMNPSEKHIFDIVVPEIKLIIVPVSTQEEMVIWWEEHISKKVDPIFDEVDYGGRYNHSFFHRLVVVAGYDIVFYNDTKILANRISADMTFNRISHAINTGIDEEPYISCVDCEFKDECPHTYCKARGEAPKPPLDFERLRQPRHMRRSNEGSDQSTQWSHDVDEAFTRINQEEYKYWDERGRIGKPVDHGKAPLTDNELKDATGLSKDADVAMNAELRAKQLSNTHSVDPGKEFPSMGEVEKLIKSRS